MKVTANGTEFDTRLEGPEGAPVVTLSHSLCCDLSAWDELAEDERGLRVKGTLLH